jgi:hypothetical protein
LKLRRLSFSLGVVAGIACGCRSSDPSSPTLTPAEAALVDVYVRIARVEAMRADTPDSVGPALDRLARVQDSTAVQEALDGLRAQPQRWEYVYDQIVKRLQAIEASPGGEAFRPDAPVPPVNDR